MIKPYLLITTNCLYRAHSKCDFKNPKHTLNSVSSKEQTHGVFVFQLFLVMNALHNNNISESFDQTHRHNMHPKIKFLCSLFIYPN
jgi:hypothetical protein